MVAPGARRLSAGDNDPPGSRSGCLGGPHGHPPTPPPAPPGAAPVRAWWGRGLGVPRPHAGYSPAASLLAPRAPPPPPAPASCSDPGHPAPSLRGVSNRPGVGPPVPAPTTEGSVLRLPWGRIGAPQRRAGSMARARCPAVPSRLCRLSALQRSTGQPATLQGTNKSPPYTRETTGQGLMTPLLFPPQTKSCWQGRGKEQGRAMPSTCPSSHLCLGRAGSLPISHLLPVPLQPLAWLWRLKGLLWDLLWS